MSTLRIFKSTIPSVNYIFGNGKPAIFVNGVFRTDIASEISALESEVTQHHPHIYIDPNEREIDSELVDPMNALRAKIIAEYVAAQTAATALTNDRGTSDQSGAKPASTVDVSPAAAGGSGVQLLANVAALVKAK